MTQGVPKHKLILGVPFYGRVYTLQNVRSTGVGAPISGATTELRYNQICAKIKTPGWKIAYTRNGRVPYAYNGNQWISYDNAR